MKLRKFISLFLGLCLTLSCALSIPASAQVPTSRSSQLRLDTSFDGNGDEGKEILFPILSQEPWYRVWVQNTGDHTIYVQVLHGDKYGPLQTPELIDLEPGEQTSLVFLSLQGGTKCFYVSSYYGYPFEGIVRVRSTSTEEELG